MLFAGLSEVMPVDNYCSYCRTELHNGDPAYGLTGGTIDADCSGFRMDCDSEWDIYCRDCMNKIDKMMAEIKRNEIAL